MNQWNTFFDLPTNGNPFTSLNVLDNTISLYGGNNITLKDSLFANSTQIISVFDDANCVIVIGSDSFQSCTLATSFSFPNVTTMV